MAPTGRRTPRWPHGWKQCAASLELAIWTLKTLKTSPMSVEGALLATALQRKRVTQLVDSLNSVRSKPDLVAPTEMEENDELRHLLD